ncbi:MAG: host-nuclease inhibitor Gam family protein [Candidatus Riflebacteria bacterium]|nr:host-nuclease inhibitor Gam family protein [Candidatus Riflebacteria bacterium]
MRPWVWKCCDCLTGQVNERRYESGKKKQVAKLFNDWTEVDQALRRMGEIDIESERLDGNMTLAINEVKESFQPRKDVLINERKDLEESITAFVEQNKGEFAAIRSKELDFGSISYRLVKKIVFKSKEAVVAALKVMGLLTYIRTIEEPDKEAMENLTNQELLKIGASRKEDDKLTIKPNIQRLSEAGKKIAA